jgi:microsomal triglyceride transfer protein large subunit
LYLEKFKVLPIDYDEIKSTLNNYQKVTFYALWKSGTIDRVFIENTKDIKLQNFLKAIISLFQYKLLDTETTEQDVSGSCTVKYSARSSTQYMKSKTDCSNDFEFHERSDSPLGNSARFTRVNIIETSADGDVESIHSSDHHQFSVNGYPNVGFKVGSLIYIKRQGALVDCDVIKADDMESAIKSLKEYKETHIVAEYISVNEKLNLVKMIKELKDNLKNDLVGKDVSASTILKLLQVGRQTKTEDFIRIINARSTKEIRMQIMDLLAAIQTEYSHKAFRSTVNLTNDEDFDSAERYLQSLSVGILPRENIIKDLFDTIDEVNENEKLKDTFVQTIASMCRKMKNQKDEVVIKFRNFLLDSIEKCEDDSCKLIFIRGLQNLRSIDTIDKLMEWSLRENYQISVASMKALSAFKSSELIADKKNFQNILSQRFRKYDSSARTIAIDILMKMHPITTEDISEYIELLKNNDPAYEVKQYLLQQMKMLAEKCSHFNDKLQSVLKSDPRVYNWNVYGALKGLSTVLTRTFSKAPSFNSSLLSVQEIKGGVLKRGYSDFINEYKGERFSLFTLGLFAGGLSSFVSSEDEDVDPNEDATATAGMELAVQGNHLRPLTFFKGNGELMGHVWSGTASEPTSAYQGITLLQDHKQYVVLNNGAVLDFSSYGAMSMDLNGKIEISLWYKNANLEVIQK